MIDKTITQRQRKRRQALNLAAQKLGYPTWGKLETDIINKKINLIIIQDLTIAQSLQPR